MSKVINFSNQNQGNQPPIPPDDPPDNMDKRLTALESKLDAILPNLATKSDIQETKLNIKESENSTIKWLVATTIAGVAIIISILSFLFSKIEHKNISTQPPVIINLPPAGGNK